MRHAWSYSCSFLILKCWHHEILIQPTVPRPRHDGVSGYSSGSKRSLSSSSTSALSSAIVLRRRRQVYSPSSATVVLVVAVTAHYTSLGIGANRLAATLRWEAHLAKLAGVLKGLTDNQTNLVVALLRDARRVLVAAIHELDEPVRQPWLDFARCARPPRSRHRAVCPRDADAPDHRR